MVGRCCKTGTWCGVTLMLPIGVCCLVLQAGCGTDRAAIVSHQDERSMTVAEADPLSEPQTVSPPTIEPAGYEGPGFSLPSPAPPPADPVPPAAATMPTVNDPPVGPPPVLPHEMSFGPPCFEPAATPRCGVQCVGCRRCRPHDWKPMQLVPWEVFAQGEYIGPARWPHVPQYRLRVDDQLDFVYRITGDSTLAAYRFVVGDTIQIEFVTAEELNRTVTVQPDGTITLSQVGRLPAAGHTADELRERIEQQYRAVLKGNPSVTVVPLKTNTRLEELRAAVDNRFTNGGQSRRARVTPEGTVQLPAIGSVPAHGLTLEELKFEIDQRYAELVPGIEVTPILAERAPRVVYVLGEVRAPGRYTLDGPTSVMQAVAMAGGWNVGAHLKDIVVLRRDANWELMATRVNLHRAMYGKNPCPDDFWLRDSDVVLVPKGPLLVADDAIELIFTRGIYGVVPFNFTIFKDLSTLGGL